MRMNDEELEKRFKYANGTLKNLLNIHDADQLAMVEYRMVAKRSLWLYQHGKNKITMDDFARIHQFLFGKIYPWAGEFRDYYLSKGDTDFMPPAAFKTAIVNLNSQLKTIERTAKPSPIQYATILDSLNYLHPFRERNGRTTRLFIQLIATNHHQFIDYHRQSDAVIDDLANANIKELSQFLIIEDTDSKQAALKRSARKQLTYLNQGKPKG